jgi:nucleotide-binding universal stress UspA family protein
MSEAMRQIVVGYDFSSSGRAALERALAIAARAPWHALQVVTAIEKRHAFPNLPTDHVDVDYADRVQQVVTGEIAGALSRGNVRAQIHFFVHARIGRPAEEILGVAKDVGADLIIVGSRGLTGLERVMLGSVSERVVREAHCTVEVVRPKTYEHVELTEVVEVEHDHAHDYHPPHRYSYDDRRAVRRPGDWPLY